MAKGVRAAFAALLIVVLLGLGGVSLVVSGVALPAAGPAAGTAQTNPASEVSQIKNPQATATSTAAQQSAPAPLSGVVDARAVVKKLNPAVVTVVNNLQSSGAGGRSFPRSAAPEALGTGLIFDSRGYIVTNNHVVENQASLEVIFSDGHQVPATLVGTDSFSDLAVIKVDATMPAVAQFGDSDALEVGQPVLAIGSALGDYANTVTEGIVSGLHRAINDAGATTSLRDLIQTDAAINHGNSGGPLIDLASGKVIGINTAVVRTTGNGVSSDVAEGLGFAIPSNTVKQVIDSLMKNGTVSRPYLGIEYTEITPDVAAYYNLTQQSGVYVTNVVAGSPAAGAGLQNNSVITKIDGTAIDQKNTLVDILLKHKVGDSVKLTVFPPNGTSETTVTVVLGARPNGQ